MLPYFAHFLTLLHSFFISLVPLFIFWLLCMTFSNPSYSRQSRSSRSLTSSVRAEVQLNTIEHIVSIASSFSYRAAWFDGIYRELNSTPSPINILWKHLAVWIFLDAYQKVSQFHHIVLNVTVSFHFPEKKEEKLQIARQCMETRKPIATNNGSCKTIKYQTRKKIKITNPIVDHFHGIKSHTLTHHRITVK